MSFELYSGNVGALWNRRRSKEDTFCLTRSLSELPTLKKFFTGSAYLVFEGHRSFSSRMEMKRCRLLGNEFQVVKS